MSRSLAPARLFTCLLLLFSAFLLFLDLFGPSLWHITPCPLCLIEQSFYLISTILALIAYIIMAGRRPTLSRWPRRLYFLIMLAMLINLAFSLYHLGAMHKLWDTSPICSLWQKGEPITDPAMLLAQLKQPVATLSCEENMAQFLGLKLLYWNIICALLSFSMSYWLFARSKAGQAANNIESQS